MSMPGEEPKPSSPSSLPAAYREPGSITNLNRFVAQFIFGNQPARKAEYMKELGFELDPKDPNKYRPAGSKEPFDREIDPGGFFNIKQYKNNPSEIGKDTVEGVLDFLEQAAIEIPSDIAAAGAGLAAAIPTFGAGGAVAAGVTRSASRAALFNVIEKGKDWIGDMLLDKEIPVDYRIRGIQTAIQAVGPEIMTKAGAAAVRLAAKGVTNSIKFMSDIGGGKISDAVWKMIKENPHLADWSFVSKAKEYLDNKVDEILGSTTGANKIPNFRESSYDSALKQRMRMLQDGRMAEAASLATNREADMSLADVLKELETEYVRLGSGAKDESIKSQMSWIKGKIDELKTDYLPAPKKLTVFDENESAFREVLQHTDPADVKLDFLKMNDIVQKMKNDINAQGGALEPAIKQIVYGSRHAEPGVSGGLDFALKQRADELGSSYSDLIAQQKKIFDIYEYIKKAGISKKDISSNVIGGTAEGGITGGIKDTKTDAVTKLFELTDDAFGMSPTDPRSISSSVKNGQAANEILSAIQSSKASRGSGGAVTAGVVGDTVSTVADVGSLPKRMLVNSAIMLSTPRFAVPVARTAIKAEQMVSRLEPTLSALASGSGPALRAASLSMPEALGLPAGAAEQQAAPEEDPFAALLDNAPAPTPAQTPTASPSPQTKPEEDPFAALLNQ